MFPDNADFDAKVTLETEVRPLDDALPFHILLIGDWKGRRLEPDDNLVGRFPIEIDRDNFNDVLQKLNVSLDLRFSDNDENFLTLRFSEFDDFHPDRIFQQLPLFNNLRDIRRKLSDSNTFNEAATEVRSWYSDNDERATDASQTVPSEDATNVKEELLEQILFQADKNSTEPERQNTESSDLKSFIKKLVRPHLIQIDQAEQSNLLMVVDEVISDLMRKVLHHHEFQALESAWRGVYFLVRGVETNSDLKIYLLDVGKSELARNLKQVNSLEESFLFKAIVEEDRILGSGNPWAFVGGNYTFSLNVDDTATLSRIAKIAAFGETPFISCMKPEMFGLSSFGAEANFNNWKVDEESAENKLWTYLCSLEESSYLGLALPRFLARLPYGEKTEPTETFSFEEFTEKNSHEQYLWLNPIFAISLLLAQTYSRYDWNIVQNLIQSIDGLPMHIYWKDGANQSKSVTEVALTENACEKIIEKGLMPLISPKNTDTIRLGSLSSVSHSSLHLAGKWK